MSECPFCNIDYNRTRIIDESPKSLTVLSNPALMRGHCLIIPRKHVEKISELDEEELKDLMGEVIKIEELLLKKYSGCDIRQNYRPFQQQSDFKVNHLHFHLQPRLLYDNLYKKCQVYEKSVFRMLNSNELNESMKFILNGNFIGDHK